MIRNQLASGIERPALVAIDVRDDVWLAAVRRSAQRLEKRGYITLNSAAECDSSSAEVLVVELPEVGLASLDILGELRRRSPQQIVIGLAPRDWEPTRTESEEWEVLAREAGASTLVCRPSDFGRLGDCFSRLLSGRHINLDAGPDALLLPGGWHSSGDSL